MVLGGGGWAGQPCLGQRQIWPLRLLRWKVWEEVQNGEKLDIVFCTSIHFKVECSNHILEFTYYLSEWSMNIAPSLIVTISIELYKGHNH